MSLYHAETKAKFTGSLPSWLHASKGKATAYCQLDRETALCLPYIQHNTKKLVIGLTVDIDQPDAAERFLDSAGYHFPLPNFYIITPENGHLQARFLLAAPVSKSPTSRAHPLKYLAAIQYGINQLVDGDPAYTNYIMKNPLHPQWEPSTTWIHGTAFTLEQLARNLPKTGKGALPLPATAKNPDTKKRSLPNESRNCWLFDESRFYSYRTVQAYREQQDYSGFSQCIREYIDRKNSELQHALPERDLRTIHKSVTGWTWEKYQPKHPNSKHCKRGTMQLNRAGIALDLQEKQQISVARTNQLRKDSTRERAIDAIGQLTAAGKKPTKAAVTRLTGIAESTLRRSVKDLFQN